MIFGGKNVYSQIIYQSDKIYNIKNTDNLIDVKQDL